MSALVGKKLNPVMFFLFIVRNALIGNLSGGEKVGNPS